MLTTFALVAPFVLMALAAIAAGAMVVRLRKRRAMRLVAKRQMAALINERFPRSLQLGGGRLPSVFYPPSEGMHECPLVLEEVRVFDTPDPAGELVAVVCPECQQDYSLTSARGVNHVRELARRAERARERRLMEKAGREVVRRAWRARTATQMLEAATTYDEWLRAVECTAESGQETIRLKRSPGVRFG
jgi:hypothetical protein